MDNTQARKSTFSMMISTTSYQKAISNTIRDPKKAERFVAAITSAVAINPTLQECEPSTVLSGALLGESLGLSPSPQLGQYYLVPYDNRKKGYKEAQFQLGYKGYIQLALRSGYYKRLNVIAIKRGELKYFNALTEELVFELIEDDEIRENTETTGYIASFEYLNGFTKTIYWSRSKMEAHALRYSKGYAAKKGYTFWEKDFDAMAFKTMLRQLISKWGIMSIELQNAYSSDGAVIKDDLTPEYSETATLELPDQRDFEPEIEPEEAPVTVAPVKEETSAPVTVKQVSLDDL